MPSEKFCDLLVGSSFRVLWFGRKAVDDAGIRRAFICVWHTTCFIPIALVGITTMDRQREIERTNGFLFSRSFMFICMIGPINRSQYKRRMSSTNRRKENRDKSDRNPKEPLRHCNYIGSHNLFSLRLYLC